MQLSLLYLFISLKKYNNIFPLACYEVVVQSLTCRGRSPLQSHFLMSHPLWQPPLRLPPPRDICHFNSSVSIALKSEQRRQGQTIGLVNFSSRNAEHHKKKNLLHQLSSTGLLPSFHSRKHLLLIELGWRASHTKCWKWYEYRWRGKKRGHKRNKQQHRHENS